MGWRLSKANVPLRLVVSNVMVVEKGDMVPQACGASKDSGGTGYARLPAPEDGIYLGPDVPVITLYELEDAVRELRRLRLRRQTEKDEELEKKFHEQTQRMVGDGND
jgi:hypothetical protein